VLFLTTLALPSLAAGGPFELPESVVQDPATSAIYVSNISGKPMERDGNGFISRLKPDGQVEEIRFLPAAGGPRLHSPCGLALTGTTLWVADIDRVVGFELSTRKVARTYALNAFNVQLANDLALGPDGRLYVSDTAGDQVLAIDLKKQGPGAVEVILKGATGGANGLAFEPGTGDLLVASSPIDFKTPAHSWRVHREAGKSFNLLAPLTQATGIYDGITSTRDGGVVLVSDWARGTIWRLGREGAATPVLQGLKAPADFAVTTDGLRLIVPDLMAGTVTLHDIP
jgi:sugar lactone lactonase YvrE